jgi:hypothetical protein
MIRLDRERYEQIPETANRGRQAGVFRLSALLVHSNQQGLYGRATQYLDNNSNDVVHLSKLESDSIAPFYLI